MEHKNWIPITDHEEFVKLHEILHSFDGGKTGIVSEVLEVIGANIKIMPVEKISEVDSEMLIDQEERMFNIANDKIRSLFFKYKVDPKPFIFLNRSRKERNVPVDTLKKNGKEPR